METTLHRQLKEFYCGDAIAREVWVADYRIDAVVDGRLIEIQQASLAALRGKLAVLLRTHDVVVVKPLAAHKTIFRRPRKNAAIASRRISPRHEKLLDVFSELVYFVHLFPHPRLTVEVLLTEQEEHRIAQTRKRRWKKDYRVEDRRLVGINSRHVLRTAADLRRLLPEELPPAFTTSDLARLASIPRWLAQKMAYCLRHAGAIEPCGKQGNALLYASLCDKEEARIVA